VSSSNGKYIWAYNFDLSIEKLNEHYPHSQNYAWEQIKNFMIDNGFEHRQKSGYLSKIKMGKKRVDNLTQDFQKTFPWFEKCANKADFTIQGDNFDALSAMKMLAEQEQEKMEINKAANLLFEEEMQNLNQSKSINHPFGDPHKIVANHPSENKHKNQIITPTIQNNNTKGFTR
jgi:virulence-associated protein VapD